ncbi:ABC transporter permease [Humibacter albus]|jgi:ribose transport system permease protein|uniref:ABC transporter permease n=1 Tax=Humibacter albus TaxID=427754 RepID=UPI0003B53B4C|nr:ABC transporter permease [Humibacter albus]
MTQTAVQGAQAPALNRGRLRAGLQQLLAFASLIVIVIFFSLTSDVFFTYDNLVNNVLVSTVVVGLLAVGTTFVIITGGIDLSIGTGMSLCAVMSGVFIENLGLPLWLGVLGAVLVGGLIGAVNGAAVAFFKFPPFIATLAMMLIAQGLALVISHTSPIYFTKAPGYIDLASGSIIPGIDVPNAVLIFFVTAIIAAILLNKTIVGRYTYAIGSNADATAISGINVRRWTWVVYVIGGLFIGLAGVMISARLASAQPATGQGYELQAIAAVVIGGTSLAGGKGSMVGTVIGSLIIAVLNNGLQLISVPQEWQNVVLGCVILFAVYMDMLRRRER